MKLKIQKIHISTGRILVAVLNRKDANSNHLREGDRIYIKNKNTTTVGIVDVTDNEELVPQGKIGMFLDLIKEGNFRAESIVDITFAPKPRSIFHIKKKLLGHVLTEKEVTEIIDDISKNRLTDIELTYFVSAGYMHEFNDDEITWMTKAMVKTGQTINFGKKIVMDKHCIGGVAGNRTTCLVVPILASAGLTIPKTSSRSITSPAGTSDTMEVLCNVALSVEEMKKVVAKCNGCLAWGGAMNLAPADDKIIKVEHPMSLDPVGQLLTSILAKKKSVGATHVLIDVPFGEGAKVSDKKRAILLKDKFEKIGHKLGMRVKVVITDGNEPIGNGIGPVLEARDILWTLMDDPRGSHQLREKAIRLSGIMLEMSGKAKKGTGDLMARELVTSGKALESFEKILRAQGGKKIKVDQLIPGNHKTTIKAKERSVVAHIDNANISAIAKLAGAPQDKEAGVFLFHHVGDIVEEDDPLYEIYAVSPEKLKQATHEAAKHSGFMLKNV